MGTPFIIAVVVIVLICVATAIMVARFIHTNGGLDTLESEQREATADSALPLIVNPTQPLSEIYYHDGQMPLAPPTVPPPGSDAGAADNSQPPQITGPLLIHHPDQ